MYRHLGGDAATLQGSLTTCKDKSVEIDSNQPSRPTSALPEIKSSRPASAAARSRPPSAALPDIKQGAPTMPLI